jgi:hypothetical protein
MRSEIGNEFRGILIMSESTIDLVGSLGDGTRRITYVCIEHVERKSCKAKRRWSALGMEAGTFEAVSVRDR